MALQEVIESYKFDDQPFNSKIDEVNRRLSSFCQSKNWVFIDNSKLTSKKALLIEVDCI